MISAAELTSMRATLATTYGATCEVLRPPSLAQRRGRSGGLAAAVRPDVVAIVDCRAAPDFQPPAERTTGGGTAALRLWVVYVAPDVDVRPGDQLRITDAETAAQYLLEVTTSNAPRLAINLEQTVRCQEILPALPTPPAVPLST